jgi:hypothetical protein
LSFCGIPLIKSKPEPLCSFCVHLWALLKPILHKTCDNLIENSEQILCKLTQKFWKVDMPSFTYFLVNILCKITHSRQPANHFAFHHKHLFTQLWKFYTIVLQPLHLLYFGCKLCAHNSQWISAALMLLEQRKLITVQILSLWDYQLPRNVIAHSAEIRTNTSGQLCADLQGIGSCDATSRANSPPAPH